MQRAQHGAIAVRSAQCRNHGKHLIEGGVPQIRRAEIARDRFHFTRYRGVFVRQVGVVAADVDDAELVAAGGKIERYRLDDGVVGIFEIDGYEYSYTPAPKRSGHVYGRMIWENSDEAVTTADKDLLYALTHCQWVRMSLVGREGVSHVKLLSDEQIQGLRAVLQLYLLKGGRI